MYVTAFYNVGDGFKNDRPANTDVSQFPQFACATTKATRAFVAFSNLHIMAEGKAHLIYSNPGDMQFLSIYGEATITTDKGILNELYGVTDDLWFSGIDDPNLTALKIAPVEAHYWNKKSNKLVTLFKFGAGLISGEQPDLAVSGKLEI